MEGQWYIACRSKELGRKPVSITVSGRRIVLFRDAQAEPAALEDRCIHRGAALSAGTTENGFLRCPYHGWCYESDGSVVEIPAMPVACPIPSNFRAPAFSCVEQDGFVWLYYSSEPPRGKPRLFPMFGTRGWNSFVMKTLFRAPVEACLENFLDCPHAATVHRFWFRTPAAQTIKTVVRTLPDGAEAEYLSEPRGKSLVWALIAPSGKHEMRHRDRFIAPSMTQVDYEFTNNARYIITSCCTPCNDSTTLVYTVITFRFSWLTPLIRLAFEPLARRIIRQDQEMLERLQENVEHFGRPRMQVIPQDLLLPHIIRWRTALQNGTPPPAAGLENRVDLRL